MQSKYRYVFDREYIHKGRIQIGKASCHVDDLDLNKLKIKVIQDFKTITRNNSEKSIHKNSVISKIERTSISNNLYLIECVSGWWCDSNWSYISDDELNFYTMPLKTSCLKIGKETSLEFTVEKEGFLLPKRTVYNYNVFIKDLDGGKKFEYEIFSILKLIFTNCEEEAITAFMPGIVDVLEQFKKMFIKLSSFKNDFKINEYENAFSNLKELLMNIYKTIKTVGNKDIHILTAREILKIKDDEKKQEKRLEEERAKVNKEKASIIIGDFNEMIKSRQSLLEQFNQKGG